MTTTQVPDPITIAAFAAAQKLDRQVGGLPHWARQWAVDTGTWDVAPPSSELEVSFVITQAGWIVEVQV